MHRHQIERSHSPEEPHHEPAERSGEEPAPEPVEFDGAKAVKHHGQQIDDQHFTAEELHRRRLNEGREEAVLVE